MARSQFRIRYPGHERDTPVVHNIGAVNREASRLHLSVLLFWRYKGTGCCVMGIPDEAGNYDSARILFFLFI